MPNYKQIYAIKKKNEERLLKLNPDLDDESGIYFFYRTDENGINYGYLGQAVDIKSRCVSHLSGYQHIDLSLKKHGLYDKEKNPYGWKLQFKHYPKEQLDEMEQYWIKEFANKGYQLRNKTSGSQGAGKQKIDEYKPSRGYRDGLDQGYKNASKEISHLFDLHLEVSTKKNPPTVNQQKALEKFNDFLNYYKGNNDAEN